MRKILAILLVLGMMLSLAACGKDGSIMGGFGTSSAHSQKERKLARGKINGNTYTNAFAELTFTKPESWTYSTDAELARIMGVAEDALGVDYEELMESTGSLYDMMVVDSVTGSNVNIMFENLDATGNAGMTASGYLDSLESQLSLTGMGYEIAGRGKANLCGNQYTTMTTYLDYMSVFMEQIHYVRVQGKYVIGVIVTLLNTEASEVEAMFSNMII